MKVLQLNCVYGTGSTGRLVQQLHTAMEAQGIESVVLYGRGPSTCEPGVHKICSDLYAKGCKAIAACTGLRYGSCLLSTAALEHRIGQEKPDVVHLQCINGNFVNIYRLTDWLKRSGIPTVLTLHAEFPFTANCSHAYDCDGWLHGCTRCPDGYRASGAWIPRTGASFQRMKRAFSGFRRLAVVSVSPWLERRAKRSPILGAARQEIICNGVDTELFRPRYFAALHQELALDDGPVLLHVTADFDPRPGHHKGAAYVLELARHLHKEGVTVLVASGRCANVENLPDNVRLLGRIDDSRRLAQLYTLADVTVVTGRRETFGMPCAESLCCGTPVVGFLAGGPESISLPAYSCFVPYGDCTALEQAARWLMAQSVPPQTIAAQAAAAYSSREMTRRYIELYRSMLCV